MAFFIVVRLGYKDMAFIFHHQIYFRPESHLQDSSTICLVLHENQTKRNPTGLQTWDLPIKNPTISMTGFQPLK
jgi:hypothetical protein